MPKQTLTETQADALRLLKSGEYIYAPYTRQVRHINHRPGQHLIASRTFESLVKKGFAEVDRRRYASARITDAGRQALAAHKEA